MYGFVKVLMIFDGFEWFWVLGWFRMGFCWFRVDFGGFECVLFVLSGFGCFRGGCGCFRGGSEWDFGVLSWF